MAATWRLLRGSVSSFWPVTSAVGVVKQAYFYPLRWAWRILSFSSAQYSGQDEQTTAPKRWAVPKVIGNAAALEQGCIQYFHNRNPRNLELLGVAEKPRGFKTKRGRVDYYHRPVMLFGLYLFIYLYSMRCLLSQING